MIVVKNLHSSNSMAREWGRPLSPRPSYSHRGGVRILVLFAPQAQSAGGIQDASHARKQVTIKSVSTRYTAPSRILIKFLTSFLTLVLHCTDLPMRNDKEHEPSCSVYLCYSPQRGVLQWMLVPLFRLSKYFYRSDSHNKQLSESQNTGNKLSNK